MKFYSFAVIAVSAILASTGVCIARTAVLDITTEKNSPKKDKFIDGYDGGMMLHTGYLSTHINPLGYDASGMTFGIGGAIKFHIGNHFRIGTEGYVSTMSQLDNGSYIKTFWAGLCSDWYWQKGKFMPYAGLTVGGGALTDYLMFEGDRNDWLPESKAVFNKTPFFALDPYIGCDYCLTKAMHLTLKFDCLSGFGGKDLFFPFGPRIYFGFIFFH